jgi:Tfp pilus assembly protein PilF
MRGRARMLRPSSASNHREALHCFERALATQPDLVGAKLGIAAVLTADIANHLSQAFEQDEARAESLLLESLAADPDIDLAHYFHLIKGTLRRLQGRLHEARAELAVAIDLAPHSTTAASQLGVTLTLLGQPEAASRYLEKSVRMGAHDPQRALLLAHLGMCRLLLGDVDTAIDQLRESTAINPHFSGAPLLLAAGLGLKSAPVEASINIRRVATLSPTTGTLSGVRNWVKRQGSADFIPVFQHTIERGLRWAGMPDE